MTFWPLWPQMTSDDFFRTIPFVEGIKLVHVHKLRVNATYSEGLDAFLVKVTFWPRDLKWPCMIF